MMRSKNNFANVTIYALMHRSALEYRRGSEIYKKTLESKSTTLDHSKFHLHLLVCYNSLILLGRALRGFAVPDSGGSIRLLKKQFFVPIIHLFL